MNGKRLFLAMVQALATLYDETLDDKIEDYLQLADPYIFRDRLSADPAVQAAFEACLKGRELDYDDTDGLYDAVDAYLASNTTFCDAFRSISYEEWRDLCKIVDRDCDWEGVFIEDGGGKVGQ